MERAQRPRSQVVLGRPFHACTSGFFAAWLQEFFRAEALKTNELLRHMWGCLPLTSAPRLQKAARLAPHLEDQRKG